ncbi:MAG: hypothetical protein MJ237_00940 [bacterium]|nr:hypothetical protein [bacterium]
MYQSYGYSYPAFRGATVSNASIPNIPQLRQQPDTVSFSANGQIQTETQKQGLSKGAKWCIGTGVVLGLGALTYILTKGKVGSKQVQQLAEHIDFKQATTYEEAIQFGKTHLGIKDYKGFGEKDLDVINWLNEGFVNVSNKVKGKARMPNIVKYAEQTDDTLQGVDRFKKVMLIDKRTYGNIDLAVQNDIDKIVTIGSNGKMDVLKPDSCSQEDFQSIVHNIRLFITKKNTMTYKEKVRLYENLREYGLNILLERPYKPVSEFGTIYHECWHLLDPKLLSRSMSKSSIDQKIAKTVSDYATSNEGEYIAEVGKRYMEGLPLTKEAVDLYNKLGGFPLPT